MDAGQRGTSVHDKQFEERLQVTGGEDVRTQGQRVNERVHCTANAVVVVREAVADGVNHAGELGIHGVRMRGPQGPQAHDRVFSHTGAVMVTLHQHLGQRQATRGGGLVVDVIILSVRVHHVQPLRWHVQRLGLERCTGLVCGLLDGAADLRARGGAQRATNVET